MQTLRSLHLLIAKTGKYRKDNAAILDKIPTRDELSRIKADYDCLGTVAT
ncbi:MAG TPA: hypothetical protein PKJ85_05015 [Nitrosomonas nitrosa]|uniref:Uncharacterized protein n=1 Tax=Nitrosomonas nitrosa TaxID=52442 RepID=A0A1I4S862_9PROT|nr:hypothetical protein [Nitrosomonas nitrosa]SFM60531.1 hypothetical protein SAMN05421880_1239 [Nitrosomonas nitrosa]HNP51144.1 hypothetical protein [Nitrosomonas nitrosa]